MKSFIVLLILVSFVIYPVHLFAEDNEMSPSRVGTEHVILIRSIFEDMSIGTKFAKNLILFFSMFYDGEVTAESKSLLDIYCMKATSSKEFCSDFKGQKFYNFIPDKVLPIGVKHYKGMVLYTRGLMRPGHNYNKALGNVEDKSGALKWIVSDIERELMGKIFCYQHSVISSLMSGERGPPGFKLTTVIERKSEVYDKYIGFYTGCYIYMMLKTWDIVEEMTSIKKLNKYITNDFKKYNISLKEIQGQYCGGEHKFLCKWYSKMLKKKEEEKQDQKKKKEKNKK